MGQEQAVRLVHNKRGKGMDIKEILEQHRLWLEISGTRANLRDTNF